MVYSLGIIPFRFLKSGGFMLCNNVCSFISWGDVMRDLILRKGSGRLSTSKAFIGGCSESSFSGCPLWFRFFFSLIWSLLLLLKFLKRSLTSDSLRNCSIWLLLKSSLCAMFVKAGSLGTLSFTGMAFVWGVSFLWESFYRVKPFNPDVWLYFSFLHPQTTC